MRTKILYIVKRVGISASQDFGWWFTYNNEWKKKEEAQQFVIDLSKNFTNHKITTHFEDNDFYFVDETTQTKTIVVPITK